jgi:hypothetical protein
MNTATGGKVTPIGAVLPDITAIRHRTAERFTLMLRVAKLVSSQGEYPCVIRDVSATGLRIRLFHQLPAEKHLVLILGNGDSYFIENVWDNDCEAGFQFSARIDVAAFMAESSRYPKRQVRLTVDLPGTLAMREFASPIVIRDLSQHGARIESERELFLGQLLRLKAQHLPQIFASVRWKTGSNYGVVFQNGFKLDELARAIWAIREPAERSAAQLTQAPAAPAIAANRRAG